MHDGAYCEGRGLHINPPIPPAFITFKNIFVFIHSVLLGFWIWIFQSQIFLLKTKNDKCLLVDE